MTHSPNRLPIGAIGNTSSEPLRYIPGTPAPIYAPPLSEADTWPSVPRYLVDPQTFGQPSPRRVSLTPEPMPVVPVRDTRRRHSWLYWRLWWLRWDIGCWIDDMRLSCGWLGEVAFLAIVAGMGAGVVVGVLLLWFAVWGAR